MQNDLLFFCRIAYFRNARASRHLKCKLNQIDGSTYSIAISLVRLTKPSVCDHSNESC